MFVDNGFRYFCMYIFIIYIITKIKRLKKVSCSSQYILISKMKYEKLTLLSRIPRFTYIRRRLALGL